MQIIRDISAINPEPSVATIGFFDGVHAGHRYLIQQVKEIAPRQVMIYTIDRETPDHDLKKAAHEELDRIAELVKEANIPVSVSY
jgi:cytidyltransferase-like protein